MSTRAQVDELFGAGGGDGVPGGGNRCPNDLFVYNANSKACYFFVHSPFSKQVLDWERGKSVCAENGAEMAHVSTEAEQEWLNRFVRTVFNDDRMKFWLGARKEAHVDPLGRWEDDGTTMPSGDDWQFWADEEMGQPNIVLAHHCLLLDEGRWEWQPCSQQHPFICKARLKD